MVARTPSDVVDAHPLLSAALVRDLRPGEVAGFLRELRDLAWLEACMALRLGMVLACIKQYDLTERGWSGFLSFCKENVDWGSSWVRAIVRLVESPLDRVKAAAAAGLLPLRVAVKAPGKVRVDEQDAWLAGEVLDEPPPSRPRLTFRDRDKDTITRARALARVCLKREGPLTALDAYILEKWREHDPGKAIEEGRTPPPAPEPRELDFGWAESAPGEALVGPWRPPADLDDALAQLEAVQAARRERLSLLARGFAVAHHCAYWIDSGHPTPWAYAEEELGWSRRTAQRHRKLGWALIWHPRLVEALRQGFSPEAARDIGWIALRDAECERLIDLAWHVGPRDLKYALAHGGDRLGDYQRALALARRHEDALLGPDGPSSLPSGTAEVVRIGADEPAPDAGTGAEPVPELSLVPAGTGAPAKESAPCAGTGRPDQPTASNAGTVVSDGLPASSAGSVGVDEAPATCGGAAPLGEAGGPGTMPAGAAATSAGTATPAGAAATSAGTATPAGAAATSAGTDAPDEATSSNAGARARRRRVRLRIALLPPEPAPVDFVRGDPDLLEASRWFLENNPLPKLTGFAACKEHARYRCGNPECWRRGLDSEAHHIQHRRHGGSDDPDNAVGLCPSCHGRGVHTADERVRVTRVELEGLRTRFWEFPSRPPVLQFIDAPPRPSWRRREAAA